MSLEGSENKPLVRRAADLPEPICQYGYPWSQIEEFFSPQQVRRLEVWMSGQTMSICDGRSYNHERKAYEETGCGPHGPVVYSWDLARFADGRGIID